MSGMSRKKVNRKRPAPLSDHPTKRSRRIAPGNIQSIFRGHAAITDFMGNYWKAYAVRKADGTVGQL